MSHVPPHRWADALAGKLDDKELRALERHAASCTRCARARDRITRTTDTFTAIKNQPAPELPWDSVRARIHWSVSTERHERLKAEELAPRRRWLGPAALGVGLAGAIIAALVTSPIGYRASSAPIAAPSVASRVPAPAPVAAAPAPIAGLVNRATGDVMINGIRPTDLFTRTLGAGTVIATGDGRVDVQFGDASAFAVGPRSMLELRRFDADAIELVVEGTVDIEVAPRTNRQSFVVRAGERVVEVRGTQFRVHHDRTTTTVACRHGLVDVRDAKGGRVEVGAARRVDLAADSAVAPERMRPLSIDEVNDLAQATPMTLPMWNIDTLLTGSAPLEIATVGRRDVRVDGVELGMAPMRVRVLPGRHTVEAADSAGRFRRAGWVDVAVPVAGSKPARLEVPAEPPPTRNINARRRQLQQGMDKARLARCVRTIAKSGLLNTGAYVQIEIAVDAQGAVNFLNVIDHDVSVEIANCVREVLADVRFGAGDAATWRERIDL